MKTSDVEESAYGRGKDFPIVIASMPASTRERRFAFGVTVLLLVTRQGRVAVTIEIWTL